MQTKPMKPDSKTSGVPDNEMAVVWRSATVEEALEITGFGKYNIGLLVVCSMTLQAMGMDLFGSAFVVTAAACDLGLNMQTRALLSATPLIGVAAGAQLWGYFSDTRGRRLTLMISMSVGFLFAALSSVAPDWPTMAVLKLLSAVFTSACNSASYTLLGESCGACHRGRVMLLSTSMLMCSQAGAAVFAYPILPLDFSIPISILGITFRSWRLLALVMSLPCAVAACLLHLLHESPKFLASTGRYEDALYVLRSIYTSNTGKDADDFPVKKLMMDEENNKPAVQGSFIRALCQQTVELFRPPYLKITLKLFYQVAVIYMTGSGFILWLPYIMNTIFVVLETGVGDDMTLCSVMRHSVVAAGNNTTPETCIETIQETTLISAMTYGAIASSANLVLSLTCGTRKRVAMMFVVTTSAAASAMINLVPMPMVGGAFFFVLMLSALSMGFLSVYFVELYPTSLRGMASCLSIMWGRMCAFAGANLIGYLLSANCEATFYGWSLFLLSAVAMCWFLPRDKSINKK